MASTLSSEDPISTAGSSSVRSFSGDGPEEMQTCDETTTSASASYKDEDDVLVKSASNSAPCKASASVAKDKASSLKWSAKWADFQKPALIGEGAYGKVYKAFYRHPSAKKTNVYAIKVFNKHYIEKLDKHNEVLNERSMLAQL